MAHGIMKHLFRIMLGVMIFAAAPVVSCCGAETIKVAVQKTGTFAWELAVIRAHGLDKQANLAIEVLELASPEAGKIALRSGTADIILSDWLWVSRERSLGAKLTFYPYSSALGAVMVPALSPIRSLADLKGRKLAVAGGPIDKSWLLLQARAKQDGIDLKSDSTIVYGAPKIPGMHSALPRAKPQPLEAGVQYTLLVQAGKLKGETNFVAKEFIPREARPR